MSQTQSNSLSRADTDQPQQQTLKSLLGAVEENDDGGFLGIDNETHQKEQVLNYDSAKFPDCNDAKSAKEFRKQT
jgi:hypothetical protein